MSTRTLRARLTRTATVLAVTVATALGAVAATAPTADATGRHNDRGTRSLAAVLAADGTGFDNNWYDFDILDNAVQAVLAAKRTSPVAVLADGNTRLTAFLPTDQAFRRLASDVLGTRNASESEVFTALATNLPIDTIEAMLLYHVVPGSTITYRSALKSDGAVLKTALSGSTLTVDVRYCFVIQLKDADPNARNAYIVWPNINQGNRQIGHAVDRVLRPIDL